MLENQPVFGTWGVWLPPADPLFRFCDAALHWTCYAAWPQRERFAGSYFHFWVEEEKRNAYWDKAFLDEKVFVTVGPAGAMVHLRETGSRIPVELGRWEAWLAAEPDAAHPVEAEALTEAKQRLRRHGSTRQALESAIDCDRKTAVMEEFRASQVAQRAADQRRREQVLQYNAACERSMLRIRDDGLICPHCQKNSKEFRLSTREGAKFAIICRNCGWTVEPLS